MFWNKKEAQDPLRPKYVLERIKTVRAGRAQSGHQLYRLQEGIVFAVAECDPAHDPGSRQELGRVEAAVGETGEWRATSEWRNSTWTESAIVRRETEQGEMFEVTVECDGQKLVCSAANLRVAYAYRNLYAALIVDQFYTIGPPWADGEIYRT